MKRNKSVKRILKEFDAAGFFDVISFEDRKRVFSYCSLDAIGAAAYIAEQSIRGRQVMVFQAGVLRALESIQNEQTFFESFAAELHLKRAKEAEMDLKQQLEERQKKAGVAL